MHKKLASELTSLAHSILQMKNKDNVFLLQKKAHEIYEKLSVLAYVEEYINSTPQATETKEELLAKITEAEEIQKLKLELAAKQREAKDNEPLIALTSENSLSEATEELIKEEKTEIIGSLDDDELKMDDFADDIAEDVIEKIEEEPITETIVEELIQKPVEEITEQPFEELEEIMFGGDDNKKFDEASFIEEAKTPTLEDELKDTISIDVTADLFTKAEPQKKSLNDRLQNTIQIGLNDRIAFVKHLFNGDSGDFNRVVSQLNTFDDEKEARKFINKTVKPDYDWSDKEEYETRFLEIVERRFA